MQTPEGPQPVVTFYARQVPDPAHSRHAGYPKFSALDYVRIEFPGEKDIREYPASPEYKARYPDQWAAYAEKRKPTPPGMPLAILFPQFPEIVATLEFVNVRTVEQLAVISDTAKQNIGLGGDEWQRKAKEFLAAAADTKGLHKINHDLDMANLTVGKLTAENTALRMRVAELEANGRVPSPTAAPPDVLAAMQAQIAQLTALATKPKGGRPRKEAQEAN